MAQSPSAAGTIDRPELAPDGRHLRAERSRKCIVEALMTLIRNREIMPSAERVSEAANVGLRTVFRHFEDMDSLYQEVGEQIEAEIRPIIDKPFTSTDWREQVLEMIDRRAEAFEWIMPFKVQANARLLQSAFMREKHRCAVEADMAGLYCVVPEELRQDDAFCSALCAAISFDVWHRLRVDQKKTPEEARHAMRRIARALLASC
ncbi:MAG: hypothetical protein Q8Q62_15140 [Mesorhizobium sp.]|nr:hypothetical protein [Mesorhizobium sp.]